jgi:hypothetical protein
LELTRRTSPFLSRCSCPLNSRPDPSGGDRLVVAFNFQRSRAAFTPASVGADREVNEHGGTGCANGVAPPGRRRSSPVPIVVDEPAAMAVLHDIEYGERGSLGGASTIRQMLDTSMPSLSSAGRGVTWPLSLRCDASLVPHPGIGPSGADISAQAGTGATMPVHCDGTGSVQLAAGGLRTGPLRVASGAILVSNLTSHACHADPGTYVSLSAVCWF